MAGGVRSQKAARASEDRGCLRDATDLPDFHSLRISVAAPSIQSGMLPAPCSSRRTPGIRCRSTLKIRHEVEDFQGNLLDPRPSVVPDPHQNHAIAVGTEHGDAPGPVARGKKRDHDCRTSGFAAYIMRRAGVRWPSPQWLVLRRGC